MCLCLLFCHKHKVPPHTRHVDCLMSLSLTFPLPPPPVDSRPRIHNDDDAPILHPHQMLIASFSASSTRNQQSDNGGRYNDNEKTHCSYPPNVGVIVYNDRTPFASATASPIIGPPTIFCCHCPQSLTCISLPGAMDVAVKQC